MKRQIEDDIHDLAHMIVRARRWFTVGERFFVKAHKWFDDVDAQLQDILLRVTTEKRKDDTR